MQAELQPLLLKDEVFRIVGCAIEVLNVLGHGLLEKSYENALAVEFGLREIPFNQQKQMDVFYKTVKVGNYVPDLIVFEKIIVETKTIDRITALERGQIINYLKIAKLQVGVIFNFKHAKLEWERIILSDYV